MFSALRREVKETVMGTGLRAASAALLAAVSLSAGAADCDISAINEGTAAEVFRACTEAAESGDTGAELNLAYIYAIWKRYQDAARWFRKAAEHGNPDAQYLLGTLSLEGKGVARSPSEAARWLRKAAEQGHSGAQHSLGTLYAGGIGVGRSMSEAVRWYRKAAEQGNAEAMNNLGSAYCA